MKLSLPAVLLLIGASVSAQEPLNPATDELPQFSLEASSFIEALLKVSARFQFPLGVEWVKTADTLKPIRFSGSHTTVKNVMDAVVSLYPGYDWRTENGVVHVFQRDLVFDRQNPLNVIIKKFDQRAETVAFANNDLTQMVSHIARHPELSGISGSVLGYPGEPVFLFAAQNVPARKILNQIVTCGLRTSPQPTPTMNRFWVATFTQPPTFTRTGFLAAVPMWDLKNESNQDQPFWILLRWGDPILENMVR